MLRLSVDLSEFNRQIGKLNDLVVDIGDFPIRHQKLIAEVVFLRLFDVFQNSIISIACKVACGANYLDGTAPHSKVTCGSVAKALQQMENYNRAKHRKLIWTVPNEISANLEHLLHLDDSFVRTIDIHGALIDEMRQVRNRIAHNSEKSRRQFQTVVQHYYGANLNTVTPGLLLLSPRRSPALLKQYLDRSRIFVKEAIRG